MRVISFVLLFSLFLAFLLPFSDLKMSGIILEAFKKVVEDYEKLESKTDAKKIETIVQGENDDAIVNWHRLGIAKALGQGIEKCSVEERQNVIDFLASKTDAFGGCNLWRLIYQMRTLSFWFWFFTKLVPWWNALLESLLIPVGAKTVLFFHDITPIEITVKVRVMVVANVWTLSNSPATYSRSIPGWWLSV